MKKSKLKKRLRKKLHVGEFQQFGFQISAQFHAKLKTAEFDELYDDFIDAIEDAKLLFGGGGEESGIKGFITERKKYASPSIEQKEKITSWLANRSEIASYKVGDLKDAWNS